MNDPMDFVITYTRDLDVMEKRLNSIPKNYISLFYIRFKRECLHRNRRVYIKSLNIKAK